MLAFSFLLRQNLTKPKQYKKKKETFIQYSLDMFKEEYEYEQQK